MFVFAVLAVWRILSALLGFVARTRGPYLVVAVVSLVLLIYQGHTGGVLVYAYGIGTGAMAPGAPPQPTAAPLFATPIPTVYVPPPTPEPAPTSAPAPTPAPPPMPTAAPPPPAPPPAAAAPPAVTAPAPAAGPSASAPREPHLPRRRPLRLRRLSSVSLAP